MNVKKSFARALKKTRTAKKITQEDFSEVSSRTYISTLERGLYTPTLEKVEALAKVMNVHPLTLLVMTYLDEKDLQELNKLISLVISEIEDIKNK